MGREPARPRPPAARRSGHQKNAQSEGIRMKLRSIAVLALFATAAFAASDDKPGEKAWDVSAPPGEKRDVAIDTHSGTWMSVDVSPDGKRVAFDMLGDIYDLPIEGGEARSLASGMAWEM